MKQKAYMVVIIGIVILAVMAVLYYAFLWLGIIVGIHDVEDPAKPEVTYGEFPFCLIYEKDGETFEVNDVLVCSFEGVEVSDIGKVRKWKSNLQSGNTKITVLKSEEIEIFYSPNMNPSAAGAYYMGDTEIYRNKDEIFPNAWQKKDYDNLEENAYIISAEEMWRKYKIKLIDWEIALPIQNRFR